MRYVFVLLAGIAIGLAFAHFWAGPIDWAGVREQTSEVVNDAATTASVRAALALQKDFELFGGIEVSTDQGVVTLSGKVGSEDQRRLAELIARGVEGVEQVVNEIEVQEAGGGGETPGPPER